MVQHVIAVDASDYVGLFTDFCDEAYHNNRKRLEYQTYRQLRKDPKATVNFYFDKDGKVEMWVAGLWQWTGDKTDESFGAFLWDYFHKELKDVMYKNDNQKLIYENENNQKFEYDIWGVKTDNTKSASAADIATKAEAYNCAADATCATCADYDTKTTIWAGDPYYSYADAQMATLAKTEVSCECRGVSDMKEVIETLTEKMKHIQDELATKANKAELNFVQEQMKDETYDIRAYVDENSMRIQDLEHLERQRREREEDTKATVNVQCTSSNYYPAKNYKVDFADFGVDERKEKENNMDTNKMFNGFEFGPVDDRVKMSPYGMAIRNAEGRYVSYDPKTANIVDVEVFNFDNHNLIYKMPVAVSAIAVGDTVIHMKKPMFVTSVTNGITVIDIFNGEVKTIMPATNMFNFNYITKVVSLFNFTGDNAPSADNPFGNVLPFMLMGNEDMDMKNIFMMMAVANGGNMNAMFQNPLMLYAMMNGDGDMKEMLPFFLMGQTGLFGAPAQTPAGNCNCGGNCGQHNQ